MQAAGLAGATVQRGVGTVDLDEVEMIRYVDRAP